MGEKKLSIFCEDMGDHIVWTVEDNGVGMDETVVKKLVKTHTTGYGVNNVNDRLVLLYGEEYGIRIESVPDVGTKIRVLIPKVEKN